MPKVFTVIYKNTLLFSAVLAVVVSAVLITTGTIAIKYMPDESSLFDKAVYFCGGKNNIKSMINGATLTSLTCQDGRYISDIDNIVIPAVSTNLEVNHE